LFDDPAFFTQKLGLASGAQAEIAANSAGIEVCPNIHSLARVPIEPTARCNLTCRMCIRNSWKDPAGDMERDLFDRLATQLRQFPLLESVMFGGFGEPTAHPDILHMIKTAKELAVRVELATNGTGLDETMIAGLMDAGLDRLWVSLDGVTDGSYDEIRPGASFDNVKETMLSLLRTCDNSSMMGMQSVRRVNHAGLSRTGARSSAGTAKSVPAWDGSTRTSPI
jgi:molybdenum cofactor biosynthesis enzyme MoaA